MNNPVGTGSLRRPRFLRVVVVIVVAAVVTTIDQLTKTLAVDHLANGAVHLIGPLSLELAFNSGVAFSIGAGLGLPIVIIALAAVLLLVWFARGMPSYPGAVAIGLVLGGTVGNLSDRLFRARGGAVIDFIHTGFWPTFNVADSAIVIGCALLILVFFRNESRRDEVGRDDVRGARLSDHAGHDEPSLFRATGRAR